MFASVDLSDFNNVHYVLSQHGCEKWMHQYGMLISALCEKTTHTISIFIGLELKKGYGQWPRLLFLLSLCQRTKGYKKQI